MNVTWALRVGLLVALTVLLRGPAPLPVSGQTEPAPPSRRERDAVHFTNALRANDPKLTDTLDGAADSLRAGHEVVILFDGRSVTALRMNSNQAKKTPLETIGLQGWFSLRHLATLRLCSSSVAAKAWPPLPSATK